VPTTVVEEHIMITTGVAGGEPRIAGHRITVANIAIRYELMGDSVDEIASGYGLSLAEVHAALAYYYDHKADIDKAIREGEAFAEALRQGMAGDLPAQTPASAV
jgi:uncharacterized protein (DUF433 family)